MAKRKILFLCTGNAARSQMAEAIAQADHGDVLEPVSAGSRPAEFVHPFAVDVLLEIGVDASEACPKSADEFRDTRFDVVVTVCDSAAQDCPSWPNALEVEHWSIEDPSWSPGDLEARRKRFRETRDELRQRIAGLARRLREGES